ncbi:MAG: galactose-1-phosphate uridylyltransferase [Nitrososphaeria archaeon]
MNDLSNELRWNPLLGTWIIVSSKRKARPWRERECPFCPGSPELGYNWDVKVLDNMFPALRVDTQTSTRTKDILKVKPGYGYCKVVVETPDHKGDLDTIPFDNLVKVIKVFREETTKLCSDKRIKYVFPFRNKGELIGVSLTHPHSQIYALPFVPTRIKSELANARAFYKKNGKCLLCHLLELERSKNKRILYSNRSFTLIMPSYAMWPYETHIYSNKHLAMLPELSDNQAKGLADTIKVTVAMYNSLFDFDLPYVMALHQAPCNNKYQFYHFHIEFYPIHRSKDKLKYAAGIEWGTYTFTYDDLPENKASEMKRATQKAFQKLSKEGYMTKGNYWL